MEWKRFKIWKSDITWINRKTGEMSKNHLRGAFLKTTKKEALIRLVIKDEEWTYYENTKCKKAWEQPGKAKSLITCRLHKHYLQTS